MWESVCEDGPEQVLRTKFQRGKDILVAGSPLWEAAQQCNQDYHWGELALYLPAIQKYKISSYPVVKWLENTNILLILGLLTAWNNDSNKTVRL